jgi:hypothetical protein
MPALVAGIQMAGKPGHDSGEAFNMTKIRSAV